MEWPEVVLEGHPKIVLEPIWALRPFSMLCRHQLAYSVDTVATFAAPGWGESKGCLGYAPGMWIFTSMSIGVNTEGCLSVGVGTT